MVQRSGASNNSATEQNTYYYYLMSTTANGHKKPTLRKAIIDDADSIDSGTCSDNSQKTSPVPPPLQKLSGMSTKIMINGSSSSSTTPNGRHYSDSEESESSLSSIGSGGAQPSSVPSDHSTGGSQRLRFSLSYLPLPDSLLKDIRDHSTLKLNGTKKTTFGALRSKVTVNGDKGDNDTKHDTVKVTSPDPDSLSSKITIKLQEMAVNSGNGTLRSSLSNGTSNGIKKKKTVAIIENHDTGNEDDESPYSLVSFSSNSSVSNGSNNNMTGTILGNANVSIASYDERRNSFSHSSNNSNNFGQKFSSFGARDPRTSRGRASSEGRYVSNKNSNNGHNYDEDDANDDDLETRSNSSSIHGRYDIYRTSSVSPNVNGSYSGDLYRSDTHYESDKYYNFHINERDVVEEDVEEPAQEDEFDETFAGYRELKSGNSTIRSAKGTVRGVKNRVRNGIATFLQMQQHTTKVSAVASFFLYFLVLLLLVSVVLMNQFVGFCLSSCSWILVFISLFEIARQPKLSKKDRY